MQEHEVHHEAQLALYLCDREALRASGVVFRCARDDRCAHAKTYTFYLGYEGPLSTTAAGTIREQLVFPPEERPILKGYGEYQDLPANAKIRVR